MACSSRSRWRCRVTLRELTFCGEFCGHDVRDDVREASPSSMPRGACDTRPCPCCHHSSPDQSPFTISPSFTLLALHAFLSLSSHSSQLPTSFTAHSTVSVNTPPTCHSIHVSLWLRQPSTLILKLPIPSLTYPTFIKASSFAHSHSCDSHSLPFSETSRSSCDTTHLKEKCIDRRVSTHRA